MKNNNKMKINSKMKINKINHKKNKRTNSNIMIYLEHFNNIIKK